MRAEAFPNEHYWLTTAACDEPLPLAGEEGLPSIADLWRRARDFFQRILDRTGPLDLYARKPRVRAPQRSELMKWLRPAEIMARSLLLARAITWLTTTDEGAKLMSGTRKLSLAERCGLALPASSHCESIPYPGLHTLAHRNAAAARPCVSAEALAQAEAGPLPEEQRNALARNRRAFRVLNWRLTGDGSNQKAAATKDVRKPILCFDDLAPDANEEDDSGERETARYTPQGLAIAARIEALGRVLANPGRAIRRLARQLAAFDGETLRCIEMPIIPYRTWLQGERESLQSIHRLSRCLGELLRRLEPRPPEPG